MSSFSQEVYKRCFPIKQPTSQSVNKWRLLYAPHYLPPWLGWPKHGGGRRQGGCLPTPLLKTRPLSNFLSLGAPEMVSQPTKSEVYCTAQWGQRGEAPVGTLMPQRHHPPRNVVLQQRVHHMMNLVLLYRSANTRSAHLTHSTKDVTSSKLVCNQRNIFHSINEPVEECSTRIDKHD